MQPLRFSQPQTAALLFVVSLMGLADIASAQQPAPPPIRSEVGFGLFQQRCMGCHGNPDVDKAPAPAILLESAAGSWRSTAASMAGAILSSATPERDDRLFPGDPVQFFTGALNLAHGAAGVLYSLDAVGCGRYPAHEDWLVELGRRLR